jgi:LacI family transcriptional regulator
MATRSVEAVNPTPAERPVAFYRGTKTVLPIKLGLPDHATVRRQLAQPVMSIRQLAQSLGLSVSTVSRALNGYSDVSVETRERVQQAARAAQYRPDPLAHRLATGRTGTVALLSSTYGASRHDSSFEPLMHGVTAALAERGYFLLAMLLPAGEGELPDLVRMLDAKLVDGLILNRTRPRDPRVALLQARGVPFVTHGRTLHNASHAWVDADNEQAMGLVVQRLVALGHQRIAMIDGPGELSFSLLRRAGFMRAVQAARLAAVDCPVVHGALSAAAGMRLALELLALPDARARPTALVCASDVLALGARLACQQRGLVVGCDVSITGYGNSEAAEFCDPPLATVEHDVADSGRHLAALLLRCLAGDDPAGLSQLVPVRLIERASVGPPMVARAG